MNEADFSAIESNHFSESQRTWLNYNNYQTQKLPEMGVSAGSEAHISDITRNTAHAIANLVSSQSSSDVCPASHTEHTQLEPLLTVRALSLNTEKSLPSFSHRKSMMIFQYGLSV